MQTMSLHALTGASAASPGAFAAAPAAASGTGTNTITSADFLTLLVTELKNQDPTQPSDPTQYVQQLVGVNSLEQLIDINKTLGALTPATAPKAV